MKILKVEEKPTSYDYDVLIDEAKVDVEGQPLPEYIMSFSWGKDVPEDVRFREMGLLCQIRVAELT